jgi:hypothetical protein
MAKITYINGGVADEAQVVALDNTVYLHGQQNGENVSTQMPSEFTSSSIKTIGAGAEYDYQSFAAAFAAEEKLLIQVGAVTDNSEPAMIVSTTIKVRAGVEQTWPAQFNLGGQPLHVIFEDETAKWTYSPLDADKDFLAGGNAANPVTFEGGQYINSGSVANTPLCTTAPNIIRNTDVIAGNADNAGISLGAMPGSILDNVTINTSGPGSTSALLAANVDIPLITLVNNFVPNLNGLTASFASTCTVGRVINRHSVTTNCSIDCGSLAVLDVGAVSATYIFSGSFAVHQYVETGPITLSNTCNKLTIVSGTASTLDMTPTTTNSNFNNITFSTAVSLSGANTSFKGCNVSGTVDIDDSFTGVIDNCTFNSQVTVPSNVNMTNCLNLDSYGATGKNNSILNCTAGYGNIAGKTITIEAGGNNNKVINCLTTAAVVNDGTASVLTSNTIIVAP